MMNDRFRQIANLILPPLMWGLSSLSLIADEARSAGEFSDMSDNLLVPSGIAFSIWFPIFIGCIAYGVYQCLPRNRDTFALREIGPWTALGFSCICGWALITAFLPAAYVQWSSALIFIPAVAALLIATIRLSRYRPSLSTGEIWTCFIPISLIAGWTSIAVFLNWTPIAYDIFAGGEASVFSSLSMLALALGFIVLMSRFMPNNWVYLLPPIWGLIFLSVRHLGGDDVQAIGIGAVIGVVALLVTVVLGRRSA